MNDNVLSTQGDAMFRCVRLPLISVDLSRTDYASRLIDIKLELSLFETASKRMPGVWGLIRLFGFSQRLASPGQKEDARHA